MEPNHDNDATTAAAVGAEAAAKNDDTSEIEAVNDADNGEKKVNDTRLIHKAIAILHERLNCSFRSKKKIVELAQHFVDGVGDEEHTTNDDTRLIHRAISILQDRLECPCHSRTQIVELARQFVDGVGDDINNMITATHTIDNSYQGLSSDRDTEQEVETALRFYPESLIRKVASFAQGSSQWPLFVYGKYRNGLRETCRLLRSYISL